MNILFFYTEAINPSKGGVERVTNTLSNYFSSQGDTVFYMAQHRDYDVTDTRQSYLPSQEVLLCPANYDYMSTFAKENEINIIINQGAINEESADFIQFCHFENVKIVSVIHNSLLSVAENFGIIYEKKLEKRNLGFLVYLLNTSFFRSILKYAYKKRKRMHYRRLVQVSNALVLLSESYIKELEFLTGEKHIKNVVAIPNPVIMPTERFKKENIALYVGRINNTQKRVNKLIDIWSKLNYNDWNLVIVGEGESLQDLKIEVERNNIRNIIFVGRRDPTDYYKSASVFCMTSTYEGLPMALLESLSYGVIPILFDSFLSASDIIENSYNGYLIPIGGDKMYIDKLNHFISTPEDISEISNNCFESSKKYDVTKVGKYWYELFSDISQC